MINVLHSIGWAIIAFLVTATISLETTLPEEDRAFRAGKGRLYVLSILGISGLVALATFCITL